MSVTGGLKGLRKLENLITFGDSWTDSGRMTFFLNNVGSEPPVGVQLPENQQTASGGLAWGQFAARAAGANYHNYAVSGATVSLKLVSRDFPEIGRPFPSVLEYQIPAFEADVKAQGFFANRAADNTLYALWIGTNDLGDNAYLTDDNAPGTTLSTFVDRVWTVFDRIYATGGRHFVLINEAPLELAPLYKASFPSANKVGRDAVQMENKMRQYTTSVNTMFEYGVPFQLLVQKRWPGATFAILDANTLMRDVFNEPAKYLDAPADALGVFNVWDPVPGVNTASSLPLNSFMWYDPLHPSEKTCECWRESTLEASLRCRS